MSTETAKKLLFIKNKLGISWEKLARRLDVTLSNIERWRTDVTPLPKNAKKVNDLYEAVKNG